MARVYLLLALLLLGGAVAAGDSEIERLKLTRAAIEAKLKLGDALRQKGDLEGALKAYRDAARIWEEHAKRKAEPAREAEPGRLPLRFPERVPAAAEVQKSVERGLAWLAAHQSEDGRWDCDGFMARDPADDKCDGPGKRLFDVGVTGLSVLALVRAGHAVPEARYRENVRLGLKFLIENQDTAGCFGTRATMHFMYNTSIATLAMCEAYHRSRNEAYRPFAQKGLDFLARARNPYMAWRYEPRGGENDTSVTSWAVQALMAGKLAGLNVDPDAFEGTRLWIDKMTDPEFGQVGYHMPGGTSARPEGLQDKFPPQKTQAMTAAGVLLRILCGEDPRRSRLVRMGASLCGELPPRWAPNKGRTDLYYWYYGTRALFEAGGREWKSWKLNLWRALLDGQRVTKGAPLGSWDPVGPWGAYGGRVYSTAMCVLALQESLRPEKERYFAIER